MGWYRRLVASLPTEDGALAALTRLLVPGSDLKLQARMQPLSTSPSAQHQAGASGGTAHY